MGENDSLCSTLLIRIRKLSTAIHVSLPLLPAFFARNLLLKLELKSSRQLLFLASFFPCQSGAKNKPPDGPIVEYDPLKKRKFPGSYSNEGWQASCVLALQAADVAISRASSNTTTGFLLRCVFSAPIKTELDRVGKMVDEVLEDLGYQVANAVDQLSEDARHAYEKETAMIDIVTNACGPYNDSMQEAFKALGKQAIGQIMEKMIDSGMLSAVEETALRAAVAQAEELAEMQLQLKRSKLPGEVCDRLALFWSGDRGNTAHPWPWPQFVAALLKTLKDGDAALAYLDGLLLEDGFAHRGLVVDCKRIIEAEATEHSDEAGATAVPGSSSVAIQALLRWQVDIDMDGNVDVDELLGIQRKCWEMAASQSCTTEMAKMVEKLASATELAKATDSAYASQPSVTDVCLSAADPRKPAFTGQADLGIVDCLLLIVAGTLIAPAGRPPVSLTPRTGAGVRDLQRILQPLSFSEEVTRLDEKLLEGTRRVRLECGRPVG